MALAMGALVLGFSGILGFMLIQNRSEPDRNNVAKINESKPVAGGPTLEPERSGASANSAANAPSAMPAANTPAASSNSSSDPSERPDIRPGGPSPELDKDGVLGGTSPEPIRPATPATSAPPAPPADQPKSELAEKKADEEKPVSTGNDVVTASRDRVAEDRKELESVTKAKRNDGPSRGSGQIQQENGVFKSQVSDDSGAKQAGDKRFTHRNGIWYDAAYHGQALKTIRRGSDEFKKLDAGLREIANSMGGTVVVVWKEKAYRIQ
jgi:hypothetical protein